MYLPSVNARCRTHRYFFNGSDSETRTTI